MTEIQVPSSVLSPYDEEFNDVVEFLKNEGYVGEDALVQKVELVVEAGNGVIIKNMEVVHE